MTEQGSGDRISELFSQALGEQVAEDRKIQQILSDVRASVSRVEEATGDALRDTVRTSVQATAGAAVDGAMARTVGPGLAELRTALDALDRRVDDIVRRLEEHTESLAAMPHGVELDAVGLSLASLRSSTLTREDLQQSLVPLIEAAVAKHTEAVTRELRGAFTESSEAIGTHLDARFSAQAGALDDQLRLQAAAVTDGITAMAADAPAPLTAAAVQEVVTSVLAARRAEIPVAQRPPSAAEVASEISGGLAGLRADLSEELAELVDDRLNELPTSASIAALADQLSSVKTDLAAWRTAGASPSPTAPAAVDHDAIAAAVVAALPVAVPAPQLPPPAPPSADVEGAIGDAVQASELRLRAHIDEAVLALAEAVLSQTPDAPSASVTPAVAPPAPITAPVPKVPKVTEAAKDTPADPVPAIEPSARLDPHVEEPEDGADPGDDDDSDEVHGKRRWFRRGDDE